METLHIFRRQLLLSKITHAKSPHLHAKIILIQNLRKFTYHKCKEKN